jgi:hypothetical protein
MLAAAARALPLIVLYAACGGHGGGSAKGGSGGAGGVGPGGQPGIGGSGGASCGNTKSKMNGVACACDGDCSSGFCVDGVCCNTACTETCKSCDTTSAPGTCAFVPSGMPPRSASVCPQSPVSTCGFDGTCNGAGACRNYVTGTVCSAGQCAGAAVQNTELCDGQGTCAPGPATICAPYNCDPTTDMCALSCASDADCAGVKCVNGSCGPKPIGAVCKSAAECASNFCADGFCCNVACTGACVSCGEVGRLGTCVTTAAGNADPHQVCQQQPQSTCGQTGTCDGIGGCARYAVETVCVMPTCSGSRVNTAGTCNGLGSCGAQLVQACDPYQCAMGSCDVICQSDTDCVSGHTCKSGSCGPKSNGQPCTDSSQCASAVCVDGVCCADACQGACRSCALPSSLGVCTPIAAKSADPRKICTDQKASSCGTDGLCDGSGGCHKYAVGTECASERCASGAYTGAASCDATGKCVAPDAILCSPYACNGPRCFTACAVDSNCSGGNVCTGNSCGLKANGAFCSTKTECKSGFCAQGVCCSSACTGACQSCALATTQGTCMPVASGSDPASICVDQGSASCGTTGKCQSGACEKYPPGSPCGAASCPASGTKFTPASSCDGAGACVTPASSSCSPYVCGAGACKSTCTSNADCVSPATCLGNSCGLKPVGAVCGTGSECGSGVCAQGVCCATACTGKCMSCALPASAGTCSPVAAGATDPTSQCMAQPTSTCGTTGFCNGSGGCQLYAAGTTCVAQSCTVGSSTATLARACDGAGTCKPATTQSCAPYACNGSACNATCAVDTDCSPGNVCNSGSCGLKRLGQLCSASTECGSGNCAQGVCCATACTGKCMSCALAATAGTCSPIAAGGTDPTGTCTAQPTSTCGTTGLCNGIGGCQLYAAGTTCVAQSCPAGSSTATLARACDGSGTCKPATTQSCAAYACNGSACNTTCAVDADCSPGYVCNSGSCGLKQLGQLCSAGTECGSGNCAQGVCCDKACAGQCMSCALPAKPGTCSPIAAGGADPTGTCMNMGASSCGQTGVCDGTGNCATYPLGTTCMPTTCAGTMLVTSTCTAPGTCTASSKDCTPFACDAMALVCKNACTSATDCASTAICSGVVGDAGVCQ